MIPGARVLVIEDNALTRKLVRVTLEKAGYQVDEAEFGQMAVQLFLANRPALVLQDLHLPDMDGITLIRKLRAIPGAESIPIFAFSGLLSKMEEARTLRAGFTDYLFKPIEPSRLLAMVEAHLRPVSSSSVSDGLGARILLVDDDPVQGKLNRLQLEQAGYAVEMVTNGLDALATARLRPPAALVTDLLMSGMTGLELCLAIRRDPRLATLPVIVTTSSFAQIDDDDVALAMRIGADAFVVRTPNFTEALDAIAGCMGARNAMHPVADADSLHADFITRLIRQLEQQASLNASLARQAAMNSALLSIMAGAAQIVVREHELPTLLHDVLARALDAGGVSAGAIYLFDASGELVLRSQIGFASGAVRQVSDFYGQPDFLRYLAKGDHPVEIPSHGVAPELAAEILAAAGTTALVVAPLAAAGKSHGALLMRAGSRELGQDFLASLGAVAAQLGQAVALSAAISDVKASEQRYRMLFEGIPVGVFRSRLDGTIVDANNELAHLLQFENREQLIGLNSVERYVDPEVRLQWRAKVDLRDDAKDDFEAQLLQRDGTPIWCAITARAVRDAQGQPTHYEGTVTDISARKRTEAALLTTQHRLGQVLTYSDAMLYVLRVAEDGALTPEWASDNFTRITGHLQEDRMRPDWWEKNVHPEDRAALEVGAPTLLERGERVIEYRLRRGDGKYIWIRDSQRVLRDDQGVPREVVGALVDVTERKNLEHQFLQAHKMEAIGQLAAGVAHDFNNMLTAISGFAELLREELDVGDSRRDHIVEIISAAQRAGTLTRQLLAFGRKQLLRPVTLDLNETVRTMQRMLHRLIGENIQLHCRTAATLSPITVDPGQLEQVLLNLVVNSRDAMPQGGILTIETSNVLFDQDAAVAHGLTQAGQYVALSVTDTGEGIPPDVQPHIFDPFFTTKEQGKGTGLGLSTVHGIVHQSGGNILLYSEPGKGTSFKLYFPATTPSGEASERKEPAAVAPGSGTVLLVEDEDAVRKFAAEVLTRSGYRVLQAGDADEALAISRAAQEPLHLLLTDVVMPGMSGSELSALLVRERPGLRVLFMSGYANEAARHVVLAPGAEFLGKPFSAATLVERVSEVLRVPA